MSKNIKQRMDKLKEVVMDLHRSAGQLDQLIQSIEHEIVGRDEIDYEYLMVFVKSQQNYRESLKSATGYDILNEKEEFYWEKLIETIKKRES